jgi:hypothetical protein
VSGLAVAEHEAPGRSPGASLRPVISPDPELNRRELFALLGSAVVASAGAQSLKTSDGAETIAALAGPSTQPLIGVAPKLAEDARFVSRSRVARVLRVTSSSQRLFETVTRLVVREPNLNGAWARISTRLARLGNAFGGGVEAAARTRAPRLGDSSEPPGAPGSLRLTGAPSRPGAVRAVARRGLMLAARGG